MRIDVTEEDLWWLEAIADARKQAESFRGTASRLDIAERLVDELELEEGDDR